jgi:hypothetical protein
MLVVTAIGGLCTIEIFADIPVTATLLFIGCIKSQGFAT